MGHERALLEGRERLELEGGRSLRLLSALEVLQAGREAEELAGAPEERPLCANACLLARAMEQDGKPLFQSGREVLEQLTPRQIARLTERWAELDKMENPGVTVEQERAAAIKKAWSTRLKSAFAGVCSGRLAPCLPRHGSER